MGRRGLLLSTFLCAQGALAAQVPPMITPGSRVRVTLARAEAPLIGVVQALRADSLLLELEPGVGETRTIHIPGVARVELSQGVQRRTAKGAAVGAVVGITLGALLGAQSDDECDVEVCVDLVSREESIVLGAVIVGLLGTAVGAVIGHLSRQERWVRVPVPLPASE